jgi:crossover junction endodeoxyribonuclease RuvC
MLIHAYDLGTTFGFAQIEDGDVKIVESRTLGGPARAHKMMAWCACLPVRMSRMPDIVAYESVNRHAGTMAAHFYGGLLCILEYICLSRGVPCVGVPVGVIKKFATGKGNATKEEMIEAALADGARDIEDDNAADAYWLAKYAEVHAEELLNPKQKKKKARKKAAQKGKRDA